MKHGRIYRSLIRGAIEVQKEKLAVMLTDCCAVFANPINKNPPSSAAAGNWETVKQLFFNASGFVDVNAASPGGVSFTNKKFGGYFTSALTNDICQPPTRYSSDGKVTWGRFLSYVDSDLKTHYVDPEKQLSHAFYVNSWPKHHWESMLTVKNDSPYTLKLYVQYQTEGPDNKLVWRGGEKPYKIDPGKSGKLRDDGVHIEAKAIRYWASSTDGQKVWDDHKNEDYDLVNSDFGYSGDLETEEVVFK
jgi:hypothetical protein